VASACGVSLADVPTNWVRIEPIIEAGADEIEFGRRGVEVWAPCSSPFYHRANNASN
jgi:hypothetical protein